MEEKRKKRFFLSHKKSSALVTSIVLHAVFIAVAVLFIAVSHVRKDEVEFKPKPVKRPNMRLRKLQVPVKQKKAQAPKLRKNIVAKPRIKKIEIKMPEIIGVKGGIGSGRGEGLGGLGFGFDMDLFGSNRGTGNEFVGHFYDLKLTKNGKLSEIGELQAKGKAKEAEGKFMEVVRGIVNGWKTYKLEDYFMAPREKFATAFMIPQINANEAPKAFGVEDQVKPMKWLALYKGQIVAPETGKYRFVGLGDDILVVRVKKRLVLDASWYHASDWRSRDPNSRKYPSYTEQHLEIGDWFSLRKGQPVPMDVLIGENPGGRCFFQLYIQKEGAAYPVNTVKYKEETLEQPILPIFKTAEIPDKLAEQMKINPSWATAAGPVFGGAN